jgi:hypothetical protein
MQNNMLSLFDYLGYAAGKELGEQVAEYATIRKAKYGMRNVSTKTYNGPVMLYTQEFLDEFFIVKNVFEPDHTEINTQLTEDSFNQTEKIF